MLLFTERNCFLIEVKGGDIRRITDDKWVISYHGNPQEEHALFQKMMKGRNLLHSNLKKKGYGLKLLPVVPIICCYDKVLRSEDIRRDLEALDEGNRRMIVTFNQLTAKIDQHEKESRKESGFRTDKTPSQIAEMVYSRVKFEPPRISFEDLEIFQRAHDFKQRGAGGEYADLIYKQFEQYFRYIISEIAEATRTNISHQHGDKIDLYPYLIEKSKLPGRSFIFFPFVRYPEVDYGDFAQLALNIGYFDEGLVRVFGINGILSPPTYGITVKASVYKGLSGFPKRIFSRICCLLRLRWSRTYSQVM